MIYRLPDGRDLPFHDLRKEFPNISLAYPPEGAILSLIGVQELPDPIVVTAEVPNE